MAAAAVGLWWAARLSRSEAPNATGPSEWAEHVARLQGRDELGLDVEVEQ